MELKILLMTIIVVAVCIFTAGLIILILDRKKKDKRTFLVSQMFIVSVVIMILGLITMYGKPIGYSDERDVHKVVAVSVADDMYKVKMDNGKIVYTDNIMFGVENVYIYSCKVKSKTLLGFSVLDTKDLLVVVPNVEGFNTMSRSEQKSILNKYNSWRN